MDITKDLIIPIIIAIITILLTAYISIQIKHSSTKDEAIKVIKSTINSILFYLWTIFLLYHFFNEVISDEPLTRKSVFVMIMDSLSLLLVFLIKFAILPILEIQRKHIDSFGKHLQITEDMVSSTNNTSNKTLEVEHPL
ncbi:hypothetical protein LCX93_07630 [Sulfurimonas sp. SWIR-19]|uniref:hypothetical protein n=1 Tax=Sulfurimonas sp. SWIR-19 TaxID=2878390 RepID=UPI001CF4FE8A|nr:hypothetical protein [Sulfurimonas sp. SWIR-19]UCM99407.1 hypothetical protein LCX93_07630 [Sulfurimonas sp. SWIR-19]